VLGSLIDEAGADRIAQNSKALGDGTRVRLLSVILNSADGRAFVSEIAQQLGVSQPTVTHHLRILFDDGLVSRDFVGRQAWYSVRPERLGDVAELLEGSAIASPEVLARIAGDLSARFQGTFSPETVARYVDESHALLVAREGVTRHLPSLTARFAADRLSALAAADAEPAGIPSVLFVCVKNAGRSQLAAAMLAALAGDRVRVRTAGSEPAASVNPVIVAALDEIGVSVGGEFPKPLTDEVVRAADVIITMGCGDACPVYPGRRYLDWDLEDPIGLPLDGVRAVRDEIDRRVRDLLGSLNAA
jgi:arsenate reductase